MDSIIDELGSAFSVSDDLDNLLPSSGSSYTPTPSITMTTAENTLVTTTTTGPISTIGSIHQSNTRSSTSQLVTMATMDTPIRRDSFNKNTIQLFFIFILVSIMFILLIAVGLTLLVGICLYRRKTYTVIGKPLISTIKKNNHSDNEGLCMTSYNGKFEVVRPNAPRDIADGHTCEASTFGFPQIVITDSAHPQELISYDVPSSLFPLAPAPAQVTPRNSARVSVLPYEITNHGSQDYDDVDGTTENDDDMESTDYIEPFDSLNQINDASWYTFSLADNPVETPPTPPERVQSIGTKRAVSDDEHIYTEPLEPSMLSGDDTSHSPRGRGLPYAPIYDVSSPSKKSISNLYHAPPESVRIIQELGRGHFGNVYLAATVGISLKNLQLSDDADTSRSLLVAIKQLKSNADSNLHESFDKEVRFMSQLHHPNVARLLAVSNRGTPFIMMEYMENGDLNEFLRKQEIQPDTVPFLDENEVTPLILLYISVQIASGMKYLASRKFVHRDLATRNCLVGREFVTKISDFGMSRNIYETSYYRVGSQLILPIRWMASETFYGKFSVKSDGWSFGVTLWEIFTLCRCVPYTGLSDDQVIADALRGEERQVLPKPFDCPEEVYDVMKRCFEPRITLRADFEEIYARLFVVYSKLGQMSKAEPI